MTGEFISTKNPTIERHKWLISALHECLTLKKPEYGGVLFTVYSIFIWILYRIKWTALSKVALLGMLGYSADLILPFVQDLLGATRILTQEEEQNVRIFVEDLNSGIKGIKTFLSFVQACQRSFKGTYPVLFFALMYIGRINNLLLAWLACTTCHGLFAMRHVMSEVTGIPTGISDAVASGVASVQNMVAKVRGSVTPPVPTSPDTSDKVDSGQAQSHDSQQSRQQAEVDSSVKDRDSQSGSGSVLGHLTGEKLPDQQEDSSSFPPQLADSASQT